MPERYEDICGALNLQTLIERRAFLDMKFLYKIINNLSNGPELLSKLNFRVPTKNTRDKSTFYAPESRINVRKNSPLVRIMKEYNMITNQNEIIDFALTETQFNTLVFKELLSLNMSNS